MTALLQRGLFEAAPPPLELRAYQLDAVERVRVKIRGGRRRILVVAPTGAGKTVIFAHVITKAIANGSPVLVMAHRVELIDQTVQKLLAAGVPPEQVGVIRGKDPRTNPRAMVQVASIDTLRNRKRPPAKLVVIDECHRSLSESYRLISAEYPDAVHLGFTATPWRLDGKGLGRMYEEIVVVTTVQRLIDDEFLVQPLVFSHPERADLSAISTRGGDYNEDQLAAAVDKAPLIGRIVEHWRRHADGLRTIAFAASVAHSIHIRDAFLAAGIRAEHIDGETAEGVRRAVLARFTSGETLVVTNCGVLCEGFDEPLAKCVILARPTKSRILYFQCVGRVLRTVPGRPDITSAIVLDHAGCANDHGLPEQTGEEDYTLDDELKNRRNAVTTRTCKVCFKVTAGAPRVCPYCGESLVTAANDTDEAQRVLEEAEGELVLRQKQEAELAALRSRIQRAAVQFDRVRSWQDGETNRRLFNRFRKSRTKMSALELRSVLGYLESGGFDADNPRTEPKAIAEIVPTETPAWLQATRPVDTTEPIVEWPL